VIEPHRIDHFCLMMDVATMSELIAALREPGWKSPTDRLSGEMAPPCSCATLTVFA